MLVQSGDAPLERELTSIETADLIEVMDGATPPIHPIAVPAQAARGNLRLLGRVGVVDPESLDDYRAHGGYAALRRAFALGPEGVIREVLDSKLMGAAAPPSRGPQMGRGRPTAAQAAFPDLQRG